jgi:hypothetical protein
MAWRADRLEAVTPDEHLARCLTHTNQFSRVEVRVSARAFLPGRDNTTSVFRVDDLTDDQIWQLADEHVTEIPGGRPVVGTGTLLAETVTEAGLRVDPDNDPPRHAVIVDWPDDKSDRKLRALKLASAARLSIRPGL